MKSIFSVEMRVEVPNVQRVMFAGKTSAKGKFLSSMNE